MSKKLLAALLAAMMALSLCACGGAGDSGDVNDPTESDSAPAGETGDVADPGEESGDSGETENDGKVAYTVTVVDEEGAPLTNVMVQLCAETCVPGSTGDTGTAQFRLEEADYHASVMVMPEGYTYAVEPDENGYFYFEDGSTDLTITLKAE